MGRTRISGFEDGERHTRLTNDEQTTILTLWSVFRSPPIMGGNQPSVAAFALSLLRQGRA
jgi:hypothetical protein